MARAMSKDDRIRQLETENALLKRELEKFKQEKHGTLVVPKHTKKLEDNYGHSGKTKGFKSTSEKKRE